MNFNNFVSSYSSCVYIWAVFCPTGARKNGRHLYQRPVVRYGVPAAIICN